MLAPAVINIQPFLPPATAGSFAVHPLSAVAVQKARSFKPASNRLSSDRELIQLVRRCPRIACAWANCSSETSGSILSFTCNGSTRRIFFRSACGPFREGSKDASFVAEGLEEETVAYLARSFAAKLQVDYKTMHSSKGLECDYVIIGGLDARLRGFPSNLETDPLFELLLPPQSNATDEERRLLYVAITRARIQAVLLTASEAPGEFVLELSRLPGLTDHLEWINIDPNNWRECAVCKRGILRTDSSNATFCTRYPRSLIEYSSARITNPSGSDHWRSQNTLSRFSHLLRPGHAEAGSGSRPDSRRSNVDLPNARTKWINSRVVTPEHPASFRQRHFMTSEPEGFKTRRFSKRLLRQRSQRCQRRAMMVSTAIDLI